MRCPWSFYKKCSVTEHVWSCIKCYDKLEYGFDDNFYCVCGKAPARCFEFKCGDGSHIADFTTFETSELIRLLSNLKPYNEVNILLLGETGVGKFTWIKGFANYLSFETMDEAKDHDAVSLIPTSFVLTDGNFEQRIISTGNDNNGNSQETGQSATQFPKTYTLPYGETTVRIIDTPGIGDTR